MVCPFQFRLRTMFWLTAVAAVASLVGPWAVKEYRHHQRQQEMKRMIDELWKIEVDARSGPPISPSRSQTEIGVAAGDALVGYAGLADAMDRGTYLCLAGPLSPT